MAAGADMALQGGEKLRAALKEISEQVRGQHSVRVGFPTGATYPDAAHTPVAQAAFWLNYGTKTAPPRPFFTDMIKDKSDEWGDGLRYALEANDYNVKKALAITGEAIAFQLQDSLINLDSPPLSKITLMLRKMRIQNKNLVVSGWTVGEAARLVENGNSTEPASEKVGVYTGHMLNSIAYSVDNNDFKFLPKTGI